MKSSGNKPKKKQQQQQPQRDARDLKNERGQVLGQPLGCG